MFPSKHHRSSGSVHRRDLFRDTGAHDGSSSGCSPFAIPTGTVFINGTQTIDLSKVSKVTFTPSCQNGYLLVATVPAPSILGLLATKFNQTDLSNFSSWYTPFSTSAVPTTYTVAAATICIWVLFVVMLLSPQTRPLFLQLVCLVSALSVALLSGETIRYLNQQYSRGFTDSVAVLDYLGASDRLMVLWIIANFALMLAEVRTVGRIFPRLRERVLVYWVGTLFAVASTVFYLVDLFAPYDPDDRNQSEDALIVFGYLFSMAISILFASCLGYYTTIKFRFLRHWRVITLGLLTIVSSIAQVVLYILDLTITTVDAWSQYVGMVAIMCACVSCWAFMDAVEEVQHKVASLSALGKEVYLEDLPRYRFQRPEKAVMTSTRTVSRLDHEDDGDDDDNAKDQEQPEYGGVFTGVWSSIKRIGATLRASSRNSSRTSYSVSVQSPHNAHLTRSGSTPTMYSRSNMTSPLSPSHHNDRPYRHYNDPEAPPVIYHPVKSARSRRDNLSTN